MVIKSGEVINPIRLETRILIAYRLENKGFGCLYEHQVHFSHYKMSFKRQNSLEIM
jgi:hypothetical protein